MEEAAKALRVAVVCLRAPTADAAMPLAFATLPPLTPEGVALSFYDEALAPLPAWFEEDAIVFLVDTATARRAYHLADASRQVGLTVLMAGAHPTVLPDEAKRYADSVLRGDAEAVWGVAMANLRDGILQPYYHHPDGAELAGLAYDYTAFPRGSYPFAARVEQSRGCRHGCQGCLAGVLYGGEVHTRPAAEVAADMAGLRRKYVFFADDNLCASRYEMEELLAAIAPLGKRWGCRMDAGLTADAALLRQMRGAGCVMVELCFGNVPAAGEADAALGQPLAACAEAVRALQAAGIMAGVRFTVGREGGTPETATALLRFAQKQKLAAVRISPLRPLPGTPLYRRLEAEGKLAVSHWWLAGEKEDALSQACREAERRFYSLPGILHRGFGNAASRKNLPLYLGLALRGRRRARGRFMPGAAGPPGQG